MDIDHAYIKQRFLDYAERYTRPVKEIAQVIGVSERTVQRWLNPTLSAVPDLVEVARFAQHYNMSVDMFLFPERFSAGMHANQMRAADFINIVGARLPAMWTNEDMVIQSCSVAFAELYDTTPEQMIGTNIYYDWRHYADDQYKWMNNRAPDVQEALTQGIAAQAREHGSASGVAWLLAPDGNLRRVVIRCYHLPENAGYLWVDLPMDQVGFQIWDKVIKAEGRDLTYQVVTLAGNELVASSESQEVISYFMAGHSQSYIARELDITRETVARYLNEWRTAYGCSDFEHLREYLWGYVAEEFVCDHFSTIRCNAANLR